MAKLDNLNIRNNLIDALPKSICRALQLKVLDARNNELTGPLLLLLLCLWDLQSNKTQPNVAVPKKLGDLVNLKSLFLSQNQIESLPSSIGSLNNVIAFNFSRIFATRSCCLLSLSLSLSLLAVDITSRSESAVSAAGVGVCAGFAIAL
jgi:Leucine-rich repeat (LRR) protein